MKIWNWFRITTTIGAVGICAVGCAKNEAAPPPPPGVAVVVAKASQRTMPVEISSVGNVESISTIAIKSLVSGQLLEVHFKEGDFVHKGQLLLTIDPSPFQAQVEQGQATLEKDQAQAQLAQANLARDTAQEQYARAEAERYATLHDKGLV